jgi:penicillin-binding protein 1B
MEVRETRDLSRGRRVSRWVLRIGAGLSLAGALAIAVEAVVRARIPTPQERMPSALFTRPVPFGRNAAPRAPIPIGTLDGSSLERRIPVKLADIPDHLIQAVLAIEDQRFYSHHGLDFRRIGGALLANLKAGGITQGASTLTQQLVKNLYLDASRTPLRKLREAAIALVLERRYSKSAILEAYLNEIYLGQSGGQPVHGVGAASRVYFGKNVQRLSLSESALLAGMIQAPNRYAPNRNPGLARERRAIVLQQMVEQNRISRNAAGKAGRASLPGGTISLAPEGKWFRDFALSMVPARQPGRGTAVYTTLDARMQQAAERAVRDGLTRLRMPGAQAALVVLDPRTGDVLAMVGGRDYQSSQFNRATDARRQPGSAFKPLVALTALAPRDGSRPAFTLASVVEDAPFAVSTEKGPWEPANYDREFHGPVTLREALEQSLNVPFARIGMAVGPENIAATAHRLGITSPLRAVPSLALGSSEVTLLELTRAYGVLAAGGMLAETRAVVGSARYGEAVPLRGPPALTRAAQADVSFLVTSALQGVVTRGTGSALNSYGRYPAIAGKTGTSSDWRDAWFLAYTPDLVVGSWVGFDDGRSLQMTGSAAALPIVAAFLEDATSSDDGREFEIPDGVTEGYAKGRDDWFTGCGSREYFLAGTEPSGRDCFRWTWEQPRLDQYRDQVEERAQDVQEKVLRAIRKFIREAQRRVQREGISEKWFVGPSR